MLSHGEDREILLNAERVLTVMETSGDESHQPKARHYYFLMKGWMNVGDADLVISFDELRHICALTLSIASNHSRTHVTL